MVVADENTVCGRKTVRYCRNGRAGTSTGLKSTNLDECKSLRIAFLENVWKIVVGEHVDELAGLYGFDTKCDRKRRRSDECTGRLE